MITQFHIPKETIEEDEADKKEVQCPNCGEVFKVQQRREEHTGLKATKIEEEGNKNEKG